MNIYAFIPLVATIAYIPLLVSTVSARPWNRQHKLFLLFLISACLWSMVDIIFRSNFFPQYSKLMVQIIIFLFAAAAVQFHCFSSSFFPEGKGRWLPFAYGSLFLIAIPIFLGYIPKDVGIIGDKVYPDYGYGIALVALPLLVLLARNVWVLVPRLKSQENPIVYNQAVSLLLCLGVLTFFMALTALPFLREYPVGHIGNIFIAVILIYAVVGQQLVDIRFVLRSGLIWLSISVIGIALFLALLLVSEILFNVRFTLPAILSATVAGIISMIIICATVQSAGTFPVSLNNHIPIFTFWTFKDVF